MSKYKIRSGSELANTPVPDITYRILGLLRANGGRMSITGQYKNEKSLLAQELAMKIAKGEEWLGFKTTQGNVLYVNLEISEEKFHERTQDFYAALKYDTNNLIQFREITITDINISLDESVTTIQDILNQCRNDNFKIDVLFLDPRARCIANSENEEVVMKDFCTNIDVLLAQNPGLCIVIVAHMGKDPAKGAIGHSRYSGWLDAEIKIYKDAHSHGNKSLEIIGRDAESAAIPLSFLYPLHKITFVEDTNRKRKVVEAKEFIIANLTHGEIAEQQLRQDARKHGITDYAFSTAIRELKDENRIETIPALGQGNRKLLKLIDQTAHK